MHVNQSETVFVEKLLTAMKAHDRASVRNLFAAFVEQNDPKLRAHLLRVVAFRQVRLKECDRLKAHRSKSRQNRASFQKNTRHFDLADDLYSETLIRALEQLLWQSGLAEAKSRLPFDPTTFKNNKHPFTTYLIVLAKFLHRSHLKSSRPGPGGTCR